MNTAVVSGLQILGDENCSDFYVRITVGIKSFGPRERRLVVLAGTKTKRNG